MPSVTQTQRFEPDRSAKDHGPSGLSSGPQRLAIVRGKSLIDPEALTQLERTAELEGMVRAVGFPDLHPGKGSPVGAAFAVQNRIYPALIGGDIGCGMALFQCDILAHKFNLDKAAKRFPSIDAPWQGDIDEALMLNGARRSGYEHALGTIGGGNHFAELQRIEKIIDQQAWDNLQLNKKNLFLLVHSGSRGFGQAVLDETLAKGASQGLALEDQRAADYLRKHDLAAAWAKANRAVIAQRFLEQVGATAGRILDLSHNSISVVESATGPLMLHRKGAAPADQGLVVIPGSRGTLSYLVMPLEQSADFNFSLAHGAGRKLARSRAEESLRSRFSRDDLERTELGSRVICDDKSLLFQEAPQAYKNIEGVIADMQGNGLISVVATLRPILTYKTRQADEDGDG